MEYLIASSKRLADDWAAQMGWKSNPVRASGYLRPTKGESFIRVNYAAEPRSLDGVPHGTTLHVGPFPEGMPTAWAETINARAFNIANSLEDCQIGPFRPMIEAPVDRAILIYDASPRLWRTSEWKAEFYESGYPWREAYSCRPISSPVCWLELPPNPPDFLIKSAGNAQEAARAEE